VQNKYLVGIVLLGLVFRLINLDQSLWLDEATSILVARDFSVSQILTKFSPGDFHPPLYYLVLHFWIYLFGSSEIGARSLSVFLGLLGIILIYMIGSKLFSKNVGLVAALLLSIAPLHIYYSQEARMYVPASTIALAVVWFFLRVVEGPRNLLFWVLFSLSSILLIYTDYPLLFLFPFLGVYLIAFQRKMLAENIKKWSVLVLALVLSFGIWSQTFYSQFLVSMAVKTVEPSSTSGNVLVRVERNVGEGNLQGINIIMSDGINAETVRVDPIDEGEETTYDISKGGLGAITKVSIRPIGGSQGNEKVGEVVGERELSYEQSVKSLGGLIAWWEFENDAKDSSGSVPLHDGTNNGATFVDDGKVGKAADFDGSNYISAGDITEYGYTICSWVYLNTGSITLYSFRGTYGAPLLFNNGGKYRVYMNDNSYRSEKPMDCRETGQDSSSWQEDA